MRFNYPSTAVVRGHGRARARAGVVNDFHGLTSFFGLSLGNGRALD